MDRCEEQRCCVPDWDCPYYAYCTRMREGRPRFRRVQDVYLPGDAPRKQS